MIKMMKRTRTRKEGILQEVEDYDDDDDSVGDCDDEEDKDAEGGHC